MKPLTCSLVQTNLFWENKSANLSMLEEKIMNINETTQVVILPEMFSTGFSMKPKNHAEAMEGATVQWMKKIAAEKKIILTGSLMIEEKENYYNRMLWVLPNEEIICYDKRHLFAFAHEQEHYTPGNERVIVSVNGWRINLQVCYDLRFPAWVRQQVKNNLPEYDAIIYVANWPERRVHAWKSLLIARAIENQCYVIGVNRVGYDGNGVYHCGNSMFIDPLGETLFEEKRRECIETVILQPEKIESIRQQFPFLPDADKFNIHL